MAKCTFFAPALLGLLLTANLAEAQPPFGRGPGGPGGPDQPTIELVDKFDADKNGYLDSEERKKARKSLQNQPQRRRGGPGGTRGSQTGKPGPKVNLADVKAYPKADLYDESVLRTFFLEFDSDDWESELSDFKPTDVEVLAKLTVDGKEYPNIGVRFRGASSYFMIPAGLKRSFNLSMDTVDEDQRLHGYKTLNLLNCNGDSSFMSSYLYSHIANQKIPAPKVNFVKVVVNGRSWGIFANAQQFNKDFIKDFYDTKKGARWKVSGNPRGDAGLRYIGDDVESYRQKYEIKSKDKEESWKDLINLCKVLDETPVRELPKALEPILDVEGALWFLAVDVATANSDGYWTRASDYSIFQDKKSKFHIIPHDMNEAFRDGHGGGPGGPGGPPRGLFGGMFGGPPPRGDRPEGPQGRDGGRERQRDGGRQRDGRGQNNRQDRGGERGGRGGWGGGRGGPGGGPGQGGVELDPMINSEQERFQLRYKLLQVPQWRAKYLEFLATIAEEHLAWESMGKRVEKARALIGDEVRADTRKLTSWEAFENATRNQEVPARGSLQEFATERAKFLLNHQEVKQAIQNRQK